MTSVDPDSFGTKWNWPFTGTLQERAAGRELADAQREAGELAVKSAEAAAAHDFAELLIKNSSGGDVGDTTTYRG